ncbi:TPA: hypothetical protein PTV74_003262 [Clostridium botulinum]|nr:hypothetical protein [Clostridium botulinum]HDK7206416.1 hypothetical protein [Clostridium botulinum]HDK7210152.1 hypothetical protein [Clostridium botulinum]HDK7265601.1 hypothetical protein [Clostridium botulinum]HDK7269449.1 hypothetical protein [Clostridium botulinum]
MANVFLHIKNHEDVEWNNNEFKEFERIPMLNEYIVPNEGSEWYKVKLVVHCPFECSCDAEVYATKVDHNEVMKLL